MAATTRFVQKKRTSNFREDETKLLIQLWGSPQVQNKLYLTHRKAPVMRMLAASMQLHGFYRTPDEIKTRIRNLKCLYHRIKRSLHSGAGLGTVDPDWPHFRAMDDVLTKQSRIHHENPYNDSVFEGPRCEDIKQEVEDIDINDDMESYTTNSLGESDFEEEPAQVRPPPLTPAPVKDTKKDKETPLTTSTKNAGTKMVSSITGGKPPVQYQGATASKQLPSLLPNISIPIQNHQHRMGPSLSVSQDTKTTAQLQTVIVNHRAVSTSGGSVKAGTMPSLPFPLLILNGIQPQQQLQQQQSQQLQQQQQQQQTVTDKAKGASLLANLALSNAGVKQPVNTVNGLNVGATSISDLSGYLKDLIEIQREKLSVEKQRLEIDRQRLELDKRRLEFEHTVGPQVMAFAPLLHDILNREKLDTSHDQLILGSFGKQKRPIDPLDENPKEAKILRSFLQTTIKRSPSDIEDELSDNEDSGIQNDDCN